MCAQQAFRLVVEQSHQTTIQDPSGGNIPKSSKEILRLGSQKSSARSVGSEKVELDLTDMINEHVSEDELSSDGSGYSDVDDVTDLHETFEELIRTPKNMRNRGEDEDFAPIATQFFDHTEPADFQASASKDHENLQLGLRAGAAEARGKRPTMEDRSVCLVDLSHGTHPLAYFAVYDGHNGVESSSVLQERLHVMVRNHPTVTSDVERAIYDSCATMDKEILATDTKRMQDTRNSLNSAGTLSGATAVLAIVSKPSQDATCMHVANVGDCRAVLCRGTEAVNLTQDHKAQVPTEQERIERAGGFVHKGRLNGVLAVSRAFGDIVHKVGEQLISQPDVISEILSKDDEFLLLASDGLFDAITSQQAVNFVRRKIRKHGDVQVAAQELVNKALALLGHDNISVVVVCLNQFAAADDTT